MKFFITLITMCGLMSNACAATKMKKICDSPRVFYFPKFLAPKECDKIIEQATPHLTRSTVLNDKGGAIDNRRTSEGMFFPQQPQQENLKKIEERIAKITNLPIENGEGLQILHYGQGAEYQPHHDYFVVSLPGGKESLARGGQRVASFLIYLNTPKKGGETIFPMADVSVNPKKGDAILFYNTTPDGKDDPRSLHGGAPVVEGEKWLLTKWIRQGEFH